VPGDGSNGQDGYVEFYCWNSGSPVLMVFKRSGRGPGALGGEDPSTTGDEPNWLIGLSKSGYGGQDLILKQPDMFALAASWDFPANMSSYIRFGTDTEATYGTEANFQASYRLTTAFVDVHEGPFLNQNRIWIGGYSDYQPDDAAYDALLTSEGIAHTTETPTAMAHRWNSGWAPVALAALYQDSLTCAHDRGQVTARVQLSQGFRQTPGKTRIFPGPCGSYV